MLYIHTPTGPITEISETGLRELLQLAAYGVKSKNGDDDFFKRSRQDFTAALETMEKLGAMT